MGFKGVKTIKACFRDARTHKEQTTSELRLRTNYEGWILSVLLAPNIHPKFKFCNKIQSDRSA